MSAAHRFDNAKRRRPEDHPNQVQLTPDYLLDPLRALMGGIDLDPCTEPDNPVGAAMFYHLPMDGCALSWNARTVFVNPPYGEVRKRWVDRCIAEAKQGTQIALLIPAATETQVFQQALMAAETVLIVRARLRFGVKRENGRQKAASHGSALFGFNLDLSAMPGELGAVLTSRRTR